MADQTYHRLGLLCRKLSLGEMQGEPQSVPGGLLHQTWAVQTEKGKFAVKELNPTIIQSPTVQNEYRLTEKISRMFAEKGIPAVAAIPVNGEVLQDAGGAKFLVFQWVEGKVQKTGTIDLRHAQEMGKVLGRMRLLNLEVPELSPQNPEPWFGDWAGLLAQAESRGVSWSSSVNPATLRRWEGEVQRAEESRTSRGVISHRDLDQKNVLWKDDKPYLVDWESAGWGGCRYGDCGTRLELERFKFGKH